MSASNGRIIKDEYSAIKNPKIRAALIAFEREASRQRTTFEYVLRKAFEQRRALRAGLPLPEIEKRRPWGLTKDRVLAAHDADPTLHYRQIAVNLGLNKEYVCKTLARNGRWPKISR